MAAPQFLLKEFVRGRGDHFFILDSDTIEFQSF